MMANVRNQALALSGLYQACELVRQIAEEGRADEAAMEVCINSVLRLDADDVDSVYGGERGLALGLATLKHQLLALGKEKDVTVTRYAVTLLHLERRLIKRKDLLKRVREGIESAVGQADYFHSTHPNVLAKLADLYKSTVSTLRPQLIVHGEQTYLTNPTNTNQLRALLLSAIRSAVLWRQCGGSRLKLLLWGRKALMAELDELLERIENSAG